MIRKSSTKTTTTEKGLKMRKKATALKAKTKTKTKPKVVIPPTITPQAAPVVPAPIIPVATPVAPKKQYLSNRVLFEEVKKCRKKGTMSDPLAKMLQMLCDNYGRKGNFVNYSYNEDMRSYAMLMLVRTWRAFDPEKSNNPFAFFTQCIKHSFIQYLNQEKRQRNIRDLLLVDQGLSPSFSFNESGSDRHYVDDEQDFQTIEHDANQLKHIEEEPITTSDGENTENNFPDEDSSEKPVTVDGATNSVDDDA